MMLRNEPDYRFHRELRSVLATLQCLSEYACEQGDAQSAAILHNAAALLELSVSTPASRAAVLSLAAQREHSGTGLM